jgi:tRNA A-37 threonylcarbamoyl transferase component Bud32
MNFLSKKEKAANLSIPIEIYNHQGEIDRINVFRLDPYSTKGFSLRSLINRMMIFCFGQQSFPVYRKNEDGKEIEVNYIQVKDLTQIVAMSARQIRKEVKNSDLTKFMMEHNIEKTIQFIEKFSYPLEQEDKSHLKALMNRIEWKNIPNILTQKGFDPSKMAEILVKLGKQIDPRYRLDCQVEKDKYGFRITDKEIFVSRLEKIQDKTIEIILNLNSLAISSKEIEFDPEFIKEVKLIQKEEALTLNTSFLKKLMDKVSGHRLADLLRQIQGQEEKIRLFNTFIAIGQELRKDFRSPLPQYVKKVQGEAPTFAFALKEDQIFVTLKNQKPIQKGAFKVVCHAMLINDLTPFVRIKVLKNNLNHPMVQKKESEIRNAVEAFECENEILNEVSQPGSQLVDPYALFLKESRLNAIAFQKQYSGNGNGILKAPVSEKLKFFQKVSEGLVSLHKKNYVHMDLKIENILTEMDSNGRLDQVKITDFGTSLKEGDWIRGGTLSNLPPEVYIKNNLGVNLKRSFKPTCKVDSFLLGVLLFRVLAHDYNRMVIGALGKEYKCLGNINFSGLEPNGIEVWITYIEKKLEEKFKGPDLKIQQGMLKVCKELLNEAEDKRWTCEQAFNELSLIEANPF